MADPLNTIVDFYLHVHTKTAFKQTVGNTKKKKLFYKAIC